LIKGAFSHSIALKFLLDAHFINPDDELQPIQLGFSNDSKFQERTSNLKDQDCA
jgi:hypothetical protein